MLPRRTKNFASSHLSSRRVTNLVAQKCKPRLTAQQMRLASSKTLDSYKPRPSDVQLQELQQLGKRMIQATVAAEQEVTAKEWRPMEPSTSEGKRKLDAKLATFPTSQPISSEKLEFLSSEPPEEDSQETNMILQPGTFVELRRNAGVAHGIVLDQTVENGLPVFQTLVMSGEVWLHRATEVVIALPRFVPLQVVRSAGNETSATNPSEIKARLKLIQQLRVFGTEVSKLSNYYDRTLTKLYEQTRASDPHQWSRVLIQSLLDEFPPPNSSSKLRLQAATVAIHDHLMNKPQYFVSDTYHRTSLVFHVRPQKEVETIETVTEWIRKRSPEVIAFVEKAKHIASISDTVRQENPCSSPTASTLQLPSFTPSDLRIIEFLQYSVRKRLTVQQSVLDALSPTIVKLVGRTATEISEEVVFELLRDIGIYAPWEDFFLLAHESVLRDSGFVQDSHTNPASSVDQQFPILPHAVKRHDWGDLAVYVIDSADAEELDDGVSIEAANDGTAWVHVHIADPTSRLGKDHQVALEAARRAVTLYCPQKTFPMLPPAFVGATVGLGVLSGGRSHQEVLTFSAKVDNDGKIIDTVVRPGLVRNVRVITYDSVDKAWDWTPNNLNYPFGKPDFFTSGTALSLDPEYLQDLNLLKSVTDKLKGPRIASAQPGWITSRGRVLFPDKPIKGNGPLISEPHLWKGFPSMVYTVEGETSSPARNMVAESMILAGRVAGIFCSERRLPALYRQAPKHNVVHVADYQRLLATMDPTTGITIAQRLKLGLTALPSLYSVTPATHHSMGITKEQGGYVRVTSPLRRFTDMIMHWQIKAALEETSAVSTPVISQVEMENYAETMVHREFTAKKLQVDNESYWVAKFIQRRVELGLDGAVLDNLPGFVTREAVMSPDRDLETNVYIPSLGFNSMLRVSSSRAQLPPGDEVRVKVKHVVAGTRPKIEVELI